MQLPHSLPRLASLPDDIRSGRWKESLPWLVSVLLVVVLAWQVAQLVAVFTGARGPAASTVAAPAGPPEPTIDLQAIMNAHLFGVAGAVGSSDPNAVAATQMNLVLVGTIAETDPEQGYAIIGESPSTAKVYSVGKTITGGTKLHAVYPDRVILDRGGRLEALMLPKKFQGGGPSGVAGAAPGAPMSTGLGSTLAERMRAMAGADATTIVEVMRPQPVFSEGHQRGYRVYPGRDRQQFTKMGLMPGDLITSINGTPLDDPARGLEILQTMNSATDVTVTVERNGQPTQITINNARIAAEAAAAAAMPEAVPVTEVPAVPPGRQDDSE